MRHLGFSAVVGAFALAFLVGCDQEGSNIDQYNVPGKIEAESFVQPGNDNKLDNQDSGQGKGESRVAGFLIRAVATASGGKVVSLAVAGRFLTYPINVAQDGKYTLAALASSVALGGRFHFEVDGVNVSGSLQAAATGNVNVFKAVGKGGIALTSGWHVLTLVLEANGSSGEVADFDAIEASADAAPVPSPSPSILPSPSPSPSASPTMAPPPPAPAPSPSVMPSPSPAPSPSPSPKPSPSPSPSVMPSPSPAPSPSPTMAPPPAPAPVAQVIVAPATATVEIGATQQLLVTLKDAAGNVLTGRVITYQSKDPTIATVTAQGVVTGVATGQVTINVTSENILATSVITVIQPTPKPFYLSDLTETFSSNGLGPIEKDESNGDINPGDGHTISIRGVQYAKGLGTHAAAEIHYNLAGGNCTRFDVVVGVDDEVVTGSVIFQVFADNVLIFNSGKVTEADAGMPIAVPIVGNKELELFVFDDGDGTTGDSADWADARITCLTKP